MSKIMFSLLVLFSILFALPVQKNLKIVYAIPRAENDMFFGPSVGFMRAAAKSLGVQLDIIESHGDHLITAAQIDSAIHSGDAPDAVIALSAKENGKVIVKTCESARIPVMIENAAILDPTFGAPRKQFRSYIGTMVPDDESAGYLLAKQLIAKGKKSSNGKIQIVAISGPQGNGPARAREQGLMRAIKESPNVELKQLVNADWDPAIAKVKFRGLMKRYPEVSVLWSASDGMALAALELAKEFRLVPGKNFVAGGVDWSKEGVDAVRTGTLSATSGGQFMEAAWALIVVFDYLNGHDFAGSGVNLKTQMALMTPGNRDLYSRILQPQNWGKIPFRQFSRTFTAHSKSYDFSLKRVLSFLK